MSALDDDQTETWEKDLEERMRSKEQEKSDLVVQGLRDATLLFDRWGSNNQTARMSLIRSTIGHHVFQNVVARIKDEHPSCQESFAALHQEITTSYQGVEAAAKRVCHHLEHLYKDSSAWKQMDQYERYLTLIRSALPSKDESSPTQDDPDETSVAVSHIRNAFATKFSGYAVELLLTHIDLHEQSNRRYSRPVTPSPEVSPKSDTTSTSLAPLPTAASSPTRAIVGIKRKMTTGGEERYSERPTRVAAASARKALKRQLDSPRPSRASGTPKTASPVASTSASGTRQPDSATVATTSSLAAKTTTTHITDPDHHYAKVLPIIQSSGFGKTKMCIHLSFYQPGILICIRPSPALNVTVSFPPQDEKVFEYFTEHQNKHCSKGIKACSDEDLDALHAVMAFFLSSYCDELHRVLAHLMHLSGCFRDPLQGSGPSGMVQGAAAPGPSTSNAARHTVANCWSTVVYALAVSLHRKDDFLKELSAEPPETLCKHSKLSSYGLLPSRSKDRALGRTPAAFTKGASGLGSEKDAAVTLEELLHPSARSNMLERICEKATLGLSEYRKGTVGDEKHSVKRSLKPALRKLESLVPEALCDKTLFFLALDEFEGFANLLPFLRRVWKIARPERSWILLLDTNSKIAPVAGPDAVAASRRTLDKESRLVQPFVEMPLDINLTLADRKNMRYKIRHQEYTMLDVNRMIPKLGRPLWNDKMYHDSEVIVAGRRVLNKLVKPDSWDWPVDTKEDDDLRKELEQRHSELFTNVMALVSQRVPLEHSFVSPTQNWQSFLTNQVSQHLRYLCHYHDDTDVVVTFVPSEPALSMAAAWSFRYPHG